MSRRSRAFENGQLGPCDSTGKTLLNEPVDGAALGASLRAETAQFDAQGLLGYTDELDMMVRLTYSLEAVRRELAATRARLRQVDAKRKKRELAPPPAEFANMVDRLVAAALQLTGDPGEESQQGAFETCRLALIEAYEKARM
jgi:hypothetical protein